MKQELLSFYIQKGEKEQVLAVCQKYGHNDRDLWIQALTYFRDMPEKEDVEEYLEKALDIVGKESILSPLLVLEILQSKPTLKFKILKKYLLQRLEVQDKVIRKNNRKINENTEKIGKMKEDIKDLRSSAKFFNAKQCSLCSENLKLPTLHFTCGHTYHDYCVESEGKRKCPKCF